ncbi:MAG: succinate dehydrogenase/fumarate reductase iron-sulfur subunit [Candidatus Njordarchaeia archaeon]
MKDGDMIKFVVFRFDPNKDEKPYYKTYEVPYRKGMVVLDGLRYIFENLDGSLSIRFSCRQGICGSCAMLINGKYDLACKTQVDKVIKNNTIKVEPMPHYPIIKDLVVDLSSLYEKVKKAKAFFIGESVDLEREYLQTPKQRVKIENYLDCVLCGACVSACPINETDWEFLGPAPLMRAYKFAGDNRDKGNGVRLAAVTGPDGIYRCHLAYSCVEACPRELAPAIAIRNLKKMAFKAALTGKVR